MLKRKFDEIDTGGSSSSSSSCGTSDADESSSCSSEATDSSVDVPTNIKGCLIGRKKAKKSVKFDKITVYYFNRLQGFACVPTDGGSTLGMGSKHAYLSKFTLSDYAKEQNRIHKLKLEELRQLNLCQLNRSKDLAADCDPSSDEDSDAGDSAFEDFEDFCFLQPISVRQRRMMLRQSGVKKIDNTEKDSCKEIRASREICGCDCRVYCDPESCACSLDGIKCQVDRLSFPCGCSKDGCGNLEGRVEFNPVRVRTHFIHTLMRLELEKKEDESALNINRRNSADSEMVKEKEDSSYLSDNADNEDIDRKDIDLTEFNSNELGSCRDCQNSDICNAMMQEVQYATMEAEQQRLAINNMCNAQQQNVQICSVDSATNGPLPRVLLFNDSEEDLYNAENTTSYYNFKHDESSYSETSECSSEGSTTYENVDYQKTYQTLHTFDNGEENANHEFCSQNPTHTQNFVSASESSTPKYISLSSSDQLYKLEPITGILNTVQNVTDSFDRSRFNTTSTWRNQNHYSTMPLYTRSLLTNSTISSCRYTLMTNTTSEEIAANYPGMMSHMTHTDQSEVTESKYNAESSMNMKQEKTYTDLDAPRSQNNQSKVYTNLDDKSPLINAAKTYTNLDVKSSGSSESSKCLILDSNGKHFSTSDSFPNPLEDSLQNTSLIQNISKKYSTTNSCQNGTGHEVPCSKESHQDSSQNFGEIIKESLVETVSA